MHFVITLAGLLAATAQTVSAQSWPQFRGPKGDGISDARALATKWSETENVRWRTAIHGKGWSSPVILGDQVWMTTARSDGKAFYALCVDRASGAVKQDLLLFTEEKPAFCHEFNSYASPTPVIEPGRLYAHFGSHGTVCLDTATGKVIWERHDLRCDHYRGPGSSPVVWRDLVILTFDGFDVQYVAALDKKTGATVWKKDRNIHYPTSNGDYKKAFSTPAVLEVDGKPQLVSPAAEATIAYDPATGDELWRITHGGMNEATQPLHGHGLIYLTTGHTAQLLAVKEGSRGLLPRDAVAWKTNRGVPTRPTPLLLGDHLFMVSDGGIATCLDARTGKQVWQERLGGAFSASPVYAAGKLYCCDQDGKTHVLEAKPTFKSLAENTLEAGCMASPAVVGDSLFIRTKTHLYCIEGH